MNYSQKHFCDFVCVWFRDQCSTLKNSLKNNAQSNIYARSHKNKIKTKFIFILCGFIITKIKYKLSFCLVYNKFLRGEL